MDIGSRNCGSLVAIQKRMVLDEALYQRGRFGNRVLVVPGLGTEDRGFESAHVSHAFGPTELVDDHGVNGQDLDDRQVVVIQLLGQFLIQLAMASDRSLCMGDHFRARSLTLPPLQPLG